MRRVNVITEAHGWILHRCAQELAERLPGVVVNATPKPKDIGYYLPAYQRWQPVQRAAIGFYTHPTEAQIASTVGSYVAHVAMNRAVSARLAAHGAPDPHTIRPGTDARSSLRFGVCGRVYKTHRKGEQLVARMVRAGFDVLGWGEGWPCRVVSGDVSTQAEFYAQIDYLVVTSTLEGGPIPVIDAIGYGVPVIAPKGVGWCDEFPCIRYRAGEWGSLYGVLLALTRPPTWAEWASAHGVLFNRIREQLAACPAA